MILCVGRPPTTRPPKTLTFLPAAAAFDFCPRCPRGRSLKLLKKRALARSPPARPQLVESVQSGLLLVFGEAVFDGGDAGLQEGDVLCEVAVAVSASAEPADDEALLLREVQDRLFDVS